MSSSDKTVRISNISAPVTAASKGGPVPDNTACDGHNIPNVSQDLEEDLAVSAESGGRGKIL